MKSNSRFCCFSPYRAFQKGNQGAGQSRARIGVYHVVQILYYGNQYWACFMCYLKIINTVCILSGKLKFFLIKILVAQTVLELMKKPIFCMFWLININSKTAWPTEILMQFLKFSDNLLQYVYNISQNCWQFWNCAQNMLTFSLRCSSSF